MVKICGLYLKRCCVVTIFVVFGQTLMAQNSTSSNNYWDNVRFGGGFGLGFGNNSFNIAVAPSAICQVNQYFAYGASLSFNYSKYEDYKFTAYGASAQTFFNPIPEIQLSVEYEQLRVNRNVVCVEENYWSPALYLGAGYGTKNYTIGIRYDVLYDDYKSIYSNSWMPFVRVYF
ncbi:alpha-ketoglutarate decarboxylase [Cellulophaga baltica]|uniref:alpha-ketoglutarate decarboxylase n=1 Tax=Cellulophaga TaxID=104264 RepID=UPI001C069D2B|nr:MULTISPECIES: alpha-ketoglutarate decarboxylase [Cellulophaga]MBU2995217.1 alpha-ketoglutarate decarboxylase [Cellulophaga baltica]MDO6766612.1 alpha-ketoglutarate decarboxylase [Cellulophaga sp. 1_MG-2023]